MDRLGLFGGPAHLEGKAHRHWPEIADDDRRAIERVLDRGVLSGPFAPEAQAFQTEFAAFVGAKHALLTHCGTSALHLALACAGVGAGDHVIVPAYSFVATPLAVLHAGGIPIFADVDPATGLLTANHATEAITSRTRAIMPVHVHGAPADLGSLVALASRSGLALVEDAAQAHGARYQGRPVGAMGTTGGFSLQSSKNLGAGEGGVFVTNDDGAAELANQIRNFGQDVLPIDRESYDADRPLDGHRSLDSTRLGWMYRGNELMAAFARSQLRRLSEWTARCQHNAERLARALAELPGVLPMPQPPTGSTCVYHKFRVRLDPHTAGVDVPPKVLRDATMRALQAEGLEVVLWQTAPLPAQGLFRRREGFGAGFPWSIDRETDFSSSYDPARFPNTQRLLDGSLVLFSQSCPLIAQDERTVDRYAEAFAKVWSRREEIVVWAKRNGRSDKREG